MALFLIFEKIILLKMGFDGDGASPEAPTGFRSGRFRRLAVR
jgi:hypothetical protein